MATGVRGSLRSLGVVLAVGAAVATGRPAAAACNHEVWTPDDMAGGGLALFFVESTPFELASGWRIEVCYAIANFGGAAQSASALILLSDASDTDLPFPITGVHEKFISTPGNAADVACSIGAGNVAELASVGTLPSSQITDMCCFDYAALAPGTCSELPGVPTQVTIPNLGQITAWDSAQVQLFAGGTGVFDDEVQLNDFNDTSGPACGLLGIELVAPLAIARARRRRERAR
jgi:hypothetical protein